MGPSDQEPAIGNELIGRNGVLRQIEKALHAQNLLITGPRRIGKTSLLLSLCERKKEDFVFLYGSFRTHDRSRQQAKLYRRLESHPLGFDFGHAMQIGHVPVLLDIVRMVTQDVERRSRRLVLIFDDFDATTVDKKATSLLFHELRKARMEFEGIRFILSGVSASSIRDTSRSLLSGALNDLIQITVGPLEFGDAAKLAAQQSTNPSEVLANRVAWLCDGFPYLTRLVSSACNEDQILRKMREQRIPRLFDIVTKMLQGPNDAFRFKETLEATSSLLAERKDFAYELLDQISVGLFDEKSDMHARATEHYSSTLRPLVESGIVARPETGGLRFASKLMHAWWFNRDGHSLRSDAYWPFPLPTKPDSVLTSYTDWADLKLGESRESAELAERAFLEFHRVDQEIAFILSNQRDVGSALSLKLAEKVLESGQNALKHCLSEDSVFLTLLGQNQDSWAHAASSGFPFVGLGGVNEIVIPFAKRLNVQNDIVISTLKEFPEFESMGIRTIGIGLVNLNDERNLIAPFALLAFFSVRRLTESQERVSRNLLRQACSKISLITSIGRRQEPFSIRRLERRD